MSFTFISSCIYAMAHRRRRRLLLGRALFADCRALGVAIFFGFQNIDSLVPPTSLASLDSISI